MANGLQEEIGHSIRDHAAALNMGIMERLLYIWELRKAQLPLLTSKTLC